MLLLSLKKYNEHTHIHRMFGNKLATLQKQVVEIAYSMSSFDSSTMLSAVQPSMSANVVSTMDSNCALLQPYLLFVRWQQETWMCKQVNTKTKSHTFQDKPQDGGNTILQNFGNYLALGMAWHPTRLKSSEHYLLPLKKSTIRHAPWKYRAVCTVCSKPTLKLLNVYMFLWTPTV
jgi:hypothetical protein